MLWWPRVRYNVSRMELNKLHILVCLVITWAMRTTLTAATETLLGLLPLHLINEVEAQVVIYRLTCNLQLKSKFTNYGNTKNLGTWILLNRDRYNDTKICVS
jgi:hypothetical protein